MEGIRLPGTSQLRWITGTHTPPHALKTKNSDCKWVHASTLSHFRCVQFFATLDCSLPGSSVHGILQARMLKWVAISSSRGSSGPGDQTQVSCSSCTAGRFFIAEPLGREISINLWVRDEKVVPKEMHAAWSQTGWASVFYVEGPQERQTNAYNMQAIWSPLVEGTAYRLKQQLVQTVGMRAWLKWWAKTKEKFVGARPSLGSLSNTSKENHTWGLATVTDRWQWNDNYTKQMWYQCTLTIGGGVYLFGLEIGCHGYTDSFLRTFYLKTWPPPQDPKAF